jgi:DNA-binding NarL/FixJ family response regulator
MRRSAGGGGRRARDDVGVVLASAQPLVRLGVRARLDGHGFRIVAEVETAEELTDAVRTHRPQLCLLDLWLPGGGLEAARAARQELDSLGVVFLMPAGDDPLLVDAVRSGASGVIFEDMDPGRLTHALRDVADGGTAFPRMLIRGVLDELLAHPEAASA